ncbi:Sulfotransferase family [Xenococcus sp. PCC 7305]|uniref:sulfotransferase family 2 domain-containing protein n=1 Tax=Xenococcus sp. PCC 7305 TaxID=102125 RepID=UPI0002ACEB83|nr:sulfotransferase family 2 domain-containing protein [Xenococcus sp. PCC 7305]ELS05345.1 Sulfotransferase family [Xenococcus sp. PCC 7305]
MIISHLYKYVFLQIPKTAGTSICKALAPTNPQCIGQTKHHIIPTKIPPDYFVFTFVRNPWDRILSYYLFRKQPLNLFRKSIHPDERIIPFIEWLQRLDDFKSYEYINPAYHIAIQPQIEIIRNYANFIGRYENLEGDFATVCRKIGIKNHLFLGHENPTRIKKNSYQEYYDFPTQEIVANLYKKDIEHFGYRFENLSVS